jgi:hypothetical protein
MGGMNILKSTKYKNLLKNNKDGLMIDDLRIIDPWDPLGFKIYDIADIIDRQQEGLHVKYRSSSILIYSNKTCKEMGMGNWRIYYCRR